MFGTIQKGEYRLPRFSKRLNNWEVVVMECFFQRLQGRRMCRDVDYQVVWTKSKDSKFTVKSLYKALEPEKQSDFLAIVIWNSWVLPRVGFFAWEATWNKVLTLDRIQRGRWALANRCYLCLSEEESLDCILLHCNMARILRHLLFALFEMSWVLPFSIRETLLGWHGSFVGKKRKKVWRATPLCPF